MTWVDGVMILVGLGLLAIFTSTAYDRWDRRGPFLQHWLRHMGWQVFVIALVIGAFLFHSFYDYLVNRVMP